MRRVARRYSWCTVVNDMLALWYNDNHRASLTVTLVSEHESVYQTRAPFRAYRTECLVKSTASEPSPGFRWNTLFCIKYQYPPPKTFIHAQQEKFCPTLVSCKITLRGTCPDQLLHNRDGPLIPYPCCNKPYWSSPPRDLLFMLTWPSYLISTLISTEEFYPGANTCVLPSLPSNLCSSAIVRTALLGLLLVTCACKKDLNLIYTRFI